MPNQVRVGVGVSGVPKAVSELDQMRDKFRKTAYEIGEAGKNGGVAFGVAAGIAAKGVDIIGGSALKAGQMIGDFIHDSIKAASDLNESTSKSQVIFGSASKAVADFAATADKSLGLSKQAALEAAASFGNLFLGTGQTQEQAAKLSTKLVTLAGDLASFNNLDPTETLQKLRSGLTGEAEPLRSVGVFLTEAKVKAKGMEMGLADAHGELSEGAKVMARYAIILDETKTAQGDFARTATGLANAQRTENAELVNLQANLGQKLLPVQLAVTHAQVDLFTGLNYLADSMSGKVTPAMLAMAAAGGKVQAITDGVRSKIHDMDVETLNAAVHFGYITQAEEDAELGARKVAAGMDHMAGASKDDAAQILNDGRKIGGIIDHIGHKAGTAADQFAAAMTDMVTDFRSAKSQLESASRDAADAWIDPQIAGLELLKNTRDQKEAEAALKSGKLRGAELLDTKIKIAELKKARIGLLTTLAEAGDKNAKAELLHIAQVNLSSKNASKDQKVYWQGVIDKINGLNTAVTNLDGKLRALDYMANRTKDDVAQIPGIWTLGGTPKPTPRASGGPVTAGHAYLVGESHPEVFVPDRSGTILPEAPRTLSGGAMSGSWNGGAIPVPVPSEWSPAMQQAFARAAAPTLIRELRRQGVI